MTDLLKEDRGLGSAYERYALYHLIDSWAEEYGALTMLEGPVDGMAGISGVHGVGLARRGVKVVSAVPTEAHADVARRVYQACDASANAEVIVAQERDVASLPKSDMVICYHALSFVEQDWRSYLAAVGKLATKVLVVAVCNPDNWGVTLMKTIARAQGNWKAGPPEEWKTQTLAPELWKIGRVRAHTYFDAPWWPDLPAFDAGADAYAGRSVFDRLKKKLRPAKEPETAKLADRFVFGPERWPYFGGPGFRDELMPALLKHPSFEASSDQIRSRTAHLHAFVVDVRPRTPQARRRLAQV
jgi:hypothetical protein